MRRAALVLLFLTLSAPGGVVAQSEHAEGLPGPADGVVAVDFSIAGPVLPEATELVLLTGERSCGVGPQADPYDAVTVAETSAEVAIRLDVVSGPDGTPCTSTGLVRIPVELSAPLGVRTIRDAGSDARALPHRNLLDPIDTGFRYSCDGASSSVADLVGPGLDVSGHGPRSTIPDARAIVDSGDFVEFLGSLGSSGAADWEAWWFRGGSWERVGWGECRPRVVLAPGLVGATWTLRGREPGPKSRRINVSVRDRSCASGRSPADRIVPPIIEVRPDSIIITIGVVAPYGSQDCQASPPAPYTVRLPVALGDRVLYDGGVFPPKERRGS